MSTSTSSSRYLDGAPRGPLSRTAAKRQAHRESCMYRQGSGWIVSTWDYAVRCSRLSGELPWSVARQTLSDWRKDRAHRLQHGYPLT